MLTLGFAGLPSAGKSTMVNALAGKRVLESGICRTTTEACLVGATNRIGAAQKWVRTKLESDDGVEFCALDLPGICDAEDKSGSFNKVTLEWASKCDVVVWVTDARTAFLTTHETREYQALRDAIQEKADEDGTLYQFLIVVAKYDATHSTKVPKTSSVVRFLEGEIRTGTEETTIDSCFARVERLFPETRVAKFSAFARILRCGSEALRALVCASTASTDGTNDTFDLKWATENITEKRLAQMSRVLRSTRIRAIAAETAVVSEREKGERKLRDVYERLAVLTARVAPSPVYDEIVEFEVSSHQQNDPRTGQVVFGTPIHSFTVMMDKAVTFVRCWYPQILGLMRKGPLKTIEMELGNGQYHIMQDVTQVIAPTVRPVYGDVIAVPAHFNHFQPNGAGGTNIKLVILAGADVGEKYALKVGEVDKKQVAALITLLRGNSGYHWRRK